MLFFIKKWEEQMALPYWKWVIVKLYRALSKNKKQIWQGFLEVLAIFFMIIFVYLFMFAFPDDDNLHRKGSNNEVKQEASHKEAYKLSK